MRDLIRPSQDWTWAVLVDTQECHANPQLEVQVIVCNTKTKFTPKLYIPERRIKADVTFFIKMAALVPSALIVQVSP